MAFLNGDIWWKHLEVITFYIKTQYKWSLFSSSQVLSDNFRQCPVKRVFSIFKHFYYRLKGRCSMSKGNCSRLMGSCNRSIGSCRRSLESCKRSKVVVGWNLVVVGRKEVAVGRKKVAVGQ